MPGSTPPISQLDWLISTTAMIVLSWSRATRDLLKSFGWGIRALHQLGCSDDGAISSSPAPYHLAGGASRIRTLGPSLARAITPVENVRCQGPVGVGALRRRKVRRRQRDRKGRGTNRLARADPIQL